jgi:monoterpene epsilon-lactone hydrolase
MQRKFPRVVFGDHTAGEAAIESVCAHEPPARVILYLHGGAYFMGSPASYRNRAMRLSYRCNAEVFVPDYRLAPEHPYPTAFDDALAAWQFVKGCRPNAQIFIAGDSAAGGLGLSLLVRVRRSPRIPFASRALQSPEFRESGQAADRPVSG